jgi:cytochrome c biogenesis factor
MQTILTIITLLLAVPTGFLCHWVNHDEKNIYNKYFPAILWILAITTAILLTTNLSYAMTTLFVFIVVLAWLNAEKFLARESLE